MNNALKNLMWVLMWICSLVVASSAIELVVFGGWWLPMPEQWRMAATLFLIMATLMWPFRR